MSSTFSGFFDKVFIVLLGKVYIVVLCKCGTKCRGKGLYRKFSPPTAFPPRTGGLSGAIPENFVDKVVTPQAGCADNSSRGATGRDAAPDIP